MEVMPQPVKSRAKPRAKVKTAKDSKAPKASNTKAKAQSMLTEAGNSTPEKKIQEDPLLTLSAQVRKSLTISPERPSRKSPNNSSDHSTDDKEVDSLLPAAKKKRLPTKRSRATNDKAKGKKNRLQKNVIDIESDDDDEFKINQSYEEDV